MRRALIIHTNPWPLWTAVERDIAVRLGQNTEVDGINTFRLLGRASVRSSGRDRLYQRLNREYERFVVPALTGRNITKQVRLCDAGLPLPATVSELRGFEVNGSKVGLAALSSAVSVTGILSAKKTAEYGDVIRRAWQSALRAQNIAEQISQLGYDAVYLFNGRHSFARPFSDTLRASSKVMMFESGGAPGSYLLADSPLHSSEAIVRLIQEHSFDPEAGRAFFEERFARTPGSSSHLFTMNQVDGLLPEQLDGRDIATFFSSSPHEFFAINDEYGFGDFKSQGDTAMALAESCAVAGLKLVVRIHPHLRLMHESWKHEWDFGALESRGVTIIKPDDPCDTYALMRASKLVFGCGSTTAAEAAYLHKPNLVIGDSFIGLMGIAHAADSEEQIDRFIKAPSCLPGSYRAALAFGSFRKRSGIPIRGFSQPGGPETARIDGRPIDPVRLALSKLKFWTGSFKNALRAPAPLVGRANFDGGRSS